MLTAVVRAQVMLNNVARAHVMLSGERYCMSASYVERRALLYERKLC